MSSAISDLVSRLTQVKESFGLKMQPPCRAEDIERLRQRARAELGADLPSGYVEFLGLADGLDWDGLLIYASRTAPLTGNPQHTVPGLIEANQNWRTYAPNASLLFFAESGDDVFVYNIGKSQYEINERQSRRLIETLPSFEELLTEAVKPHL
jgi:hypothetical protein